jgi:hypothetical protein
MVVLVGETVTDPEVALPVEKPAPEHEVALFELQVRVGDCPATMVLGLALRAAVGALRLDPGLDPTVRVEFVCRAAPSRCR